MSQTTSFSKELWQANRWRWLAPLLIVIAMAGLLSVYRMVYAGRVAQLESQYQEESARLAELEKERVDVETMLVEAEQTRAGIEMLYQERFATESERLTDVLREVRELAQRAGLSPDSISYPEEEIAGQGLVRKHIGFTVQGNYSSLRRFINFLELSGSFLTLESIGVSDADGEMLNISLQLSTLFSRPEETSVSGTGRAAGGGG